MMPTRSSACASAASNASIRDTRAWSEKTARIASVVKSVSGTGVGRAPSDVEEDRLLGSLQVDVEAVDDGTLLHLVLRDERFPPHLPFDHVQHRIAGVRGFLVGEIHPGHEADVDAPSEKEEGDVRRHRAPTPSRDRSRLDGLECIDAAREIRRRASPTAKRRVDRFWLAVGGMVVFARRVRLPDLEQDVANRSARPVEHTPLDADALAFRLRTGEHVRNVVVEDLDAYRFRGEPDVYIRA